MFKKYGTQFLTKDVLEKNSFTLTNDVSSLGSETLTVLVGVRLVLGPAAPETLLDSSSEEGSLIFSLIQKSEEGLEGCPPAEAGL